MPDTIELLKTQLQQLPQGERADLAYFLIQSLDEGEDADAEAAWEKELSRRVNEIRGGTVTGIPAEQVFADLRKKFS